MRHENVNYLVVGIFILAMLAGLLVVFALITGRTGATDEYYVHYDNIGGIKYGTAVSYEGFQVGQVEEIVPLQKAGATRYKLTLGVRSGWKIPEDSIAQIISSGLLAAVAIDIKEGTSGRYLEPGGEIRGEEGKDLLAAVGTTANELSVLIQDVRETVQTLNVQTRESVPEILGQVRELVGKLNRSADTLEQWLNEDNQRQVSAFLENMQATSTDIRALAANTDDTLKKLDELIAGSNTLVTENREDIRRAITDLTASLQVVANHINAIAFNLEGTTRNMHEFSRQIRENPGLLLGSTPPKDESGSVAK